MVWLSLQSPLFPILSILLIMTVLIILKSLWTKLITELTGVTFPPNDINHAMRRNWISRFLEFQYSVVLIEWLRLWRSIVNCCWRSWLIRRNSRYRRFFPRQFIQIICLLMVNDNVGDDWLDRLSCIRLIVYVLHYLHLIQIQNRPVVDSFELSCSHVLQITSVFEVITFFY